MARVEETSTEQQDLDPLGLGWRLVRRKETEFDDPRWAIVFPDGETLNLNHGTWRGQQEVSRLWQRALELKAAEVRQSKRAGALEDELDIVRAAETAKNVKILTLWGLLIRARELILKRCLKPIDPYEEAACLLEEIDAALGEGAPTPADAEAGAPETPGAPSPTTRALTGEDIEQAVNEILRRHKELHDEGERLLKLAPEMPPLVPDDPLSSEIVRAHDRCDDLYRGMRSFEARLANLEETTAALERRLDEDGNP